jgi:hypothetical protein
LVVNPHKSAFPEKRIWELNIDVSNVNDMGKRISQGQLFIYRLATLSYWSWWNLFSAIW